MSVMDFNTEIGKNIDHAASLLKAGEIVAIPTETVYGLAGNGLSAEAALKIYKAKNRPLHNPLILHISDWAKIENLVTNLPEQLQPLVNHFREGPLTLLLPKSKIVPDIITAGLDRVAIRVPAHPITKLLLTSIDIPLAAPSANPFGYISPTTADHVFKQLKGKVPYILDGGPCSIGIESTIIGVEEEQVIVYRLGSMDVNELEDIVGPILLPQKLRDSKSIVAPGMLKQHYSPRTKFFFGNDLSEVLKRHERSQIGGLVFSHKIDALDSDKQLVLSPEGNLNEAAVNLYRYMHLLDNMNLDAIWAAPLPEEGIGNAINDRLERAGSKC